MTLDEMTALLNGVCRAARFQLEVRLTPHTLARSGGGAANGRKDETISRRSGGGGRVSTPANGQSGSSGAGANPMDLEMWLVDERDHIERQALPIRFRTSNGQGDFVFPVMTLQTPEGTVTVRVSGSISFGTAGEARGVHVSITRLLTFASKSEAKGEETSTGVSEIEAEHVPGPEDVVAFRMPPIQFAGSGLKLPDVLSLRLRARLSK